MEYTTDAEVQAVIDETLKVLDMQHVRIDWSWNGRFTSRMGDARITSRDKQTGQMRLSKPLWPHAPVEERRDTIIHEVCHITADLRHKRNCGHGLLWKAEMIRAGGKPERCYSWRRPDHLRRKQRRVRVYCGCESRTVPAGKATKIANGTASYVCRQCKQRIRSASPPTRKVKPKKLQDFFRLP